MPLGFLASQRRRTLPSCSSLSASWIKRSRKVKHGVTEIMPVPRNCNITVLPAGSFWCLFICRTLGSEQLFWFCCQPNAAYRKSCWVYHRMGIDNAGILCYIGSTEVNRWVPSGQLEPVSMKQQVGFFFAVAKQIPSEHLFRKKVSAVFFRTDSLPLLQHQSPHSGSSVAPQQQSFHRNPL